MKRKLCAALLVVFGATVPAADAFAWGATGHEWVSGWCKHGR